MIRILGIDPGSRLTGFGVIEAEAGRLRCVTTGCIRTPDEGLANRLKSIFEGVASLVGDFQPAEVAIENIFVYRNADSALKLGQARGAALSAISVRDVPVYEYTPSQIKKAIVGKGNASKQQVQHMVKALLTLGQAPQSDAADALAAALCHEHLRRQPLLAVRQGRRRWRP